MDKIPPISKPLTAAQNYIMIMLTINFVSFAAAWFMIAALMERTAELDALLNEVRVLRAQVETAPGPMEPGGALMLTSSLAAGGARL